MFAGAELSYSEQLDVPPLEQREEGTIMTYHKSGELKWQATWSTQKISKEEQSYLKLVLNGSGVTSPFTQETTWRAESLWNLNGGFFPVSADTVIKNTAGKTIRIEEKVFDYTKGVSKFNRQDFPSGDKFSKEYNVPMGTLIVEGIVFALRSLPFETEGTVRTSLLSNEPELYNIEFVQRGIEKVMTKEGEVECYKVELIPKLGIVGVLRVFFPKTYFWFTVESPHRWVRYEGLENGLGTPEVFMEVTDIINTQN